MSVNAKTEKITTIQKSAGPGCIIQALWFVFITNEFKDATIATLNVCQSKFNRMTLFKITAWKNYSIRLYKTFKTISILPQASIHKAGHTITDTVLDSGAICLQKNEQ